MRVWEFGGFVEDGEIESMEGKRSENDGESDEGIGWLLGQWGRSWRGGKKAQREKEKWVKGMKKKKGISCFNERADESRFLSSTNLINWIPPVD